jgi:hypothetical protein
MKLSIILSTSTFPSTTFARLYKRDEYGTGCTDASVTVPLVAVRAAMSSLLKTDPIVASPTEISTEEEEEILSTDAGTPATVSVDTSSTSTEPDIPYTYDCVSDCNSDYSQCRTAPGANMSTCATQYAECLGYNPFNGEGSLVTPTACSVPTSDVPEPTLPDPSSVQSSMVSQSPPPQQDTTMQPTPTFKRPIATCGPGMCTYPTMTDNEAPPMMTETPVIVGGAGGLQPFMTFMAFAALVAL